VAKFVLKNAWIQINSVDLSDHVRSVAVNMSAQLQESQGMGSDGLERVAGLRDDAFELTLAQDFAASEVDATLWPLFDGGSEFLIEVAADGTAISSTNPKYSGSVLLESYPPLSGDIGGLAESSIRLPVNGKISRATA
jgi:hypothetical protein